MKTILIALLFSLIPLKALASLQHTLLKQTHPVSINQRIVTSSFITTETIESGAKIIYFQTIVYHCRNESTLNKLLITRTYDLVTMDRAHRFSDLWIIEKYYDPYFDHLSVELDELQLYD